LIALLASRRVIDSARLHGAAFGGATFYLLWAVYYAILLCLVLLGLWNFAHSCNMQF